MNTSTFSDSKKHYEILDGLRGVAAIMVVIFHVLEIFTGGDHTKQIINHGYLAVDFFFLLSGFVIAHAYDDRWNTMTLGQFFKRRLIRLHPMIIVGMTLGAIGFYWSASPELFPLVGGIPLWKLLIFTLLGYLMIPVPVSWEIRGWTEMYPLNGPAWSLFLEYIANICYALFLRKASNKTLAVLVVLAGILTSYYAVTSRSGDLIGGWALNAEQLYVGFVRLLYPFLAGLLLSRIFKPIQFNNGFLWCSILVIAALAIPRVGGIENHWLNGVYDAFTVIVIFPIIIFLGASGNITSQLSTKICHFLGDISYPIYITHFPILYIFYAWVVKNKVPMEEIVLVGSGIVLLSIALAYLSFKFYDLPVRKWLSKRY